MAAPRDSRHHKKRHGQHQKRSHHFMKVYAPYIPLTLIISATLIFSAVAPAKAHHGVLSYATDESVSGLLQATNQQRTANGVSGLNINGQLNQAAQAKANDMVARDYWAHNTPDGNPPWVFFTQAGYQYQAAGENLAYGFATSSDTVAGWMNSPPHRENLLNGIYKDVGFGIANSPNYVGAGPETIIVAEYGAPQVAAAETSAPSAPTAAKPTSSSPPATAPTPTPATPAPSSQPTASQALPQTAPATKTPASAQVPPTAIADTAPHNINRIQAFTNGSLPWITSLSLTLAVVGAAVVALKHSWALQKVLIKGERYVVQHVAFDLTVVSLVGLALVISQTAGVIR